MVECLTRDRRATGSSLTGVTVCGPLARHIYLSLVLVQPMKARPNITERLLMGHKESNRKKKFFQVLTTLGQIHCILPFALKLYLTCRLLITFASGLDPDKAQHSVQA